MVESSRSFIAGPMPTGDFLSQFLPMPRPFDRVSLIAFHETAFRAVPEQAATVTEIQRPLVCFPFLCV